jgi:GNAT superfamily N-acetyltransferase
MVAVNDRATVETRRSFDPVSAIIDITLPPGSPADRRTNEIVILIRHAGGRIRADSSRYPVDPRLLGAGNHGSLARRRTTGDVALAAPQPPAAPNAGPWSLRRRGRGLVWEPSAMVDIALRDGSTARLREVRPSDEPALLAFLASMDAGDRYLRFFSGGVNLPSVARRAVDADGRDRFGLVAVAPDDRTILAHGCAARSDPGSSEAEVAFAVDDSLRGEGIGTTMLAHLAQAAGAAGVRWLVAFVLPQNSAMIDVFRESGLRPAVHAGPDELYVRMPAALGLVAL